MVCLELYQQGTIQRTSSLKCEKVKEYETFLMSAKAAQTKETALLLKASRDNNC